jgi:hypothetical protein
MIRHKAGHERLVPAIDPGELHRQQHRRGDRRGSFRPRSLRLEPRTRQHRGFCRRSARRDADAGQLGTDPCEVALVFLSRSGGQNPLGGQRRRGRQRSADDRHDRAVRDQLSERNADADRSSHQDQQPVHDRLRLRQRLDFDPVCSHPDRRFTRSFVAGFVPAYPRHPHIAAPRPPVCVDARHEAGHERLGEG